MVEIPCGGKLRHSNTWLRLSTPQSTVIGDNHVDGASFFRMRFEGTSNKTYGTKKMDKAML